MRMDENPILKSRLRNPDVESPLVSVIIPVHNGERYLSFSIESVMNQSYRPIELIVINDGSSDGSERIIQKYKHLTSLKQSNKGISAARNLGISKANGEYIAFLDADDLWLETKIEKQVRFLLKNPTSGIVICKYTGFFERKDTLPPWLNRELFKKERFGYIPSCLLSRSKVIDKVGLFDENYQTGEDLDWLTRAKDGLQKIGKLDEILVQKRYHSHNISYRDFEDRKHLLKIFRSSLQRKSKVTEDE